MTQKYFSPRYYQQRIPTNYWWGRLLRWALGPVGLIGIISVLLVSVSFLFAFRVHGFDSDEVILQNALLYWKPFHHMTYYGDAGASFIDRIPLYWIVGRFISPGRHALFVDGAVLTIGNFILFYWSAIYFLKKAGIKLTYWSLTPFIWLSSFGYAVTEYFVGTNFHNIEVGIIFAICVLVAKIYYGEFRPLSSWKTAVSTVLCCLVIGLAIVSDRYVFYYGLLPILIYAATGFVFKQNSVVRKRIGLVFSVVFLSVVSGAFIQLILSKSGIDFINGVGARTPQFVGYGSIYTSVSATIYNLFVIFGADFWGSNVLSAITASAVLNTALLVLILCAVKLYFSPPSKVQLKLTHYTTLQFMCLLFLWSMFLLTISNLGGAGSFHYLIILPFVGAALLVSLMASIRGPGFKLMSALLIAATLLNLGINFYYSKVPTAMTSGLFVSYNQGNGYNYDIVHALEAHDLTKGYANYWNANVTSYLSGGRVDDIPALCVNDSYSVVYKWLMTSSQLTRQAPNTFFLFDPHFQEPPNCPPAVIKVQFGSPAQTFRINGDTVYVYDRNIIMKLQ